jgi:hypothetical protein
MNKKIVLFLGILLLVGALTIQENHDIQATYTEQIGVYEIQDIQSSTELVYPSTTQILLDQLSLVYGTQKLTIRAEDLNQNPSEHSEMFTQENPLGLQILSPSLLGGSTDQRYDFELTTNQVAICKWRFKAATSSPAPYEEFGYEDGVHSLDYRFSEKYRFPEGEFVPVEIICANDGESIKQQMYAEIGWDSTTTETYNRAYVNTQDQAKAGLEKYAFVRTQTDDTISREHNVRFDVYSQELSTCSLTSESKTLLSTLRKHHIFLELDNSNTVYNINCINSVGKQVSLGQYQPQFIVVDEQPEIYDFEQTAIMIRSPSITRNQEYQLIAETSLPSSCNQTFTNTRMAAYGNDKRLHQTNIELQEGENTREISCVGSNNRTRTIPYTITVRPQRPEFQVTSAKQCSSETLIDISFDADEDIKYFRLSSTLSGSVDVLRKPSGTIRQGNLTEIGSSLLVSAVDSLGRETPVDPISIGEMAGANCELTKTQYLELLSPADANTESEEFNLRIRSSYPSRCTLNSNEGVDFSPSANEEYHTIESAQQYFSKGTNEFSVTCVDIADQKTTKNFKLYWQLEQPAFTLSANPSNLTTYTQPYSNITIQADMEVRCRIGQQQKSTLNVTHTFLVAMSEPNNQTYEVACQNAHENGPVVETITIYEDFPSELNLSDGTNKTSTSQTVDFDIHTTLKSFCELNIINETDDMLTKNSYDHYLTKTLPQGVHPYTIECSEINTNKSKRKNGSITVDTMPPVLQLESSQLTCGLNEYTVYGNLTDNVGIGKVVISFNGHNITKTKLPASLKNLDLTENQTYPIIVTAYDTAGNSVTASDNVEAVAEENGACDTQPPSIKINTKDVADGSRVKLYCEDDYGCPDTFSLGIGTIGSTCSADQTYNFQDSNNTYIKISEDIILTNTSNICWEVKDVSGNTATGQRKVTVSDAEYPSYCSNDVQDESETDVDCGGDCPSCEPDPNTLCSNGVFDKDYETDVDCGGIYCDKCEVGNTCESRVDCQSLVCSSSVCKEATCSDGRKNGQETGIDCGGNTCGVCSQGEGCATDVDCGSGLVCSYGTCMQDGNERVDSRNEEPAYDDDEYLDSEEESSFAGILLIILGAVSMLGGGGWMYWTHEHEDGGAAAQRPTTQDVQGDVLEHAKEDRIPDFASSKLREEARTKKVAKREAARDELMGAFGSKRPTKKPHKRVEMTPDVEQEITEDADTEDVFADLEDIANNK